MTPEAELIARCQKGDARAWDDLFDRHYAPTTRFIFQLSADCSGKTRREFPEVFLSVIKNLGAFHGKSQLQTSILRFASNKARDFREKQHAAKRGGGQTPLSIEAENPETGRTLDLPSREVRPDDALMQTERAHEVGLALEKLNQPCQEIIQLRYFADLSYEEISRELGVNQKTVSSRLSSNAWTTWKKPSLRSGKKPTVARLT